MINKKLNRKLAFSLIELSMVILIISIVILALIKGGQVISRAKTIAAAKITKSSVVSKIDGLVSWYETTMDQSFDSVEAYDGGNISTWYNINPYNKSIETASSNPTGINAYQNTSDNQPKYITNAINGLPVLRFDGANDFLNYNGSAIANNNYTVFVVEQRRTALANYFIGYSSGASSLHLGYSADRSMKINQDTDFTNLDSYSSAIPKIHSFVFNSAYGKSYYYYPKSISYPNNQQIALTEKTPLSSYNNAAIGKKDASFYNGDIGEIIIYKKALSDQERQDVEAYLSKKWSISLSN